MLIPDGIWLDLPHELYIADPALGSHDLKALLLNAVFWHGSQRNPTWKAILAEMQTKGQRAKVAFGTAYGSCLHTIALEPDQFEARYFTPPPRPELPNTKEDIRQALCERGLTPLPLARKSIEHEAMARMYGITLASDWDDEIRLAANGRAIIPESWRASLQVTRRVLERHSEAMNFLRKGRAEVSVFFSDEHGDRYKCRFDYLRVRVVADLKTYENKAGGDAVAVFGAARDKFCYDMQAAAYMHIRTSVLPDLLARGRIWRGPPVATEDGGIEALPPTKDDVAFFEEVAAYSDPEWFWLTVSTMGVPEVDTICFPKSLIAFAAASTQVEQAKQNYRDMRAKFGPDDDELWVSDRGLIRFTDYSFSQRSMNRGAVLHESF